MSDNDESTDVLQSDSSTDIPAETTEEPVKTAEENYRDAFQSEKERADIAERKAEHYEQMVMNQQVPQQSPRGEAEEYSEEFLDEYATNKSLKIMLDKEREKDAVSQRERQVSDAEIQSKKNHIDWDEVVMKYAKDIFSQPENKGLYDSVMSAPNPAELAYQIGKSHPHYLESVKKQTTQDVTQQINTNLNKTPTLSNMGSGVVNTSDADEEAKSIANLSREEFKEKYMNKF